MTVIPFGEWLPDQPPFENPGSPTMTNVVPVTPRSYGPWPAPSKFGTAALTNPCLGSYAVKDTSGNVYDFAGDQSRLYLLSTASTTFTDVSKAAGGPYTLGGDTTFGYWDATAFGQRVIFTDFDDPIQTYLIGTDTAFSDLSENAPRARTCAVIRDFLMVGNTFDGTGGNNPARVWWAAIGDPTSWPTPGTNAAVEVQSDFQDLVQTDVGAVKKLLGNGLLGADGAAFCERGIYRFAYVGSPIIFDFAVAQGAPGTLSARSVIQNRGIAYYLGEDGFYAFDGSSPAIPIGAQKIDTTFFNDLLPGLASTVLGAVVPNLKLLLWAYPGAGAVANQYNRLLVYNWNLARWSLIDLTATPLEWITRWLSLGYTLDQLDPFGDLETLPYSLDSPFWQGGNPLISAFDTTNALNYFGGPNLAPTCDTTEIQPLPGRRAKVTMTRPIADGSGASIAIAARNNTFDTVSFGTAVAANAAGWCPQLTAGRYLRGRLTMPAGSTFTHLQGIDAEVRPDGRRW